MDKTLELELIRVETLADWEICRSIRKAELHDARGRSDMYVENKTGDHDVCNETYIARLGGVPVGTIRSDYIAGSRCCIRQMAVVADYHGRSIGSRLVSFVEKRARIANKRMLVVNAALSAVGFYERLGFIASVWDADDIRGYENEAIQMIKSLA